jgi:hypothetical protein
MLTKSNPTECISVSILIRGRISTKILATVKYFLLWIVISRVTWDIFSYSVYDVSEKTWEVFDKEFSQCTYIRAASLYTAYLEKIQHMRSEIRIYIFLWGCVYKPSDPVGDFEKPILLFKSLVEKIYFHIKTYQPNRTSSNQF